MEDIIAIKVLDKKKGEAAFLTWGRVLDRVDPAPMEKMLAKFLPKYGLNNVIKVSVCWSLKDVASYPYFFEKLVFFAWNPIPFGKRYKSWASRMKRAISAGEEIYFLGVKKRSEPRRRY